MGHVFKHVLHFFLPLFRKRLKLILEPILGSEWPKRATMGPKEPSGASKNQKPSFSKTIKKNNWFFKGFWLQRPLKKASRGRRRLPKGTQKIQDPKKMESKIETKNYKKIGTHFGAHSETQAQQ